MVQWIIQNLVGGSRMGVWIALISSKGREEGKGREAPGVREPRSKGVKE